MVAYLMSVTALLDAQLRRMQASVPALDWAVLGAYAGPLGRAAQGWDWRLLAVTLCCGYLLWEQARYLLRARSLPGPAWVPPLLGNVVAVVRDPAAFWKKQAAFGPLSWNALVGK